MATAGVWFDFSTPYNSNWMIKGLCVDVLRFLGASSKDHNIIVSRRAELGGVVFNCKLMLKHFGHK